MDFRIWRKRKNRNSEERGLTVYSGGAAVKFGKISSGSYGAMNLSAFFACVNLIANSVAQLPVKVISRSKGERNELGSHPVVRALNGGLLDRFTLVKSLIWSVILRGNGFALIRRDKNGGVDEVVFLEASDVLICYDKVKGTLYYQVPILGMRHVEPVNMLHFRMWTYDGVNGIPLIRFMCRSLGIAGANEDSANDFFSAGMNVGGYLASSTPITQKQKQEVIESWQQAYGAGGTGVAVLNSNLSYHTTAINPSDAQLLESREFSVADICRFFNVIPSLLGMAGGVTYSSVEMVSNFFLTYCLQPWISMMEAEMNRKALRPSEAGLEVVFETNDFLRVSKADLAKFYRDLVDGGIMSRNEARRQLGLNEVDGLDDLTVSYSDVTQNTLNNDSTSSDINAEDKQEQ